MGYRGMNNANSFTGGLMQGLGLYNDIKRTNMYEDDINERRDRQKKLDAIEAQKTEAYLAGLKRQGEIADATEARNAEMHQQKMIQMKAGDLADRLRTINGIPDENQRQNALDSLAMSINDDPYLVKYMDLRPQEGTGQGRKIIGFQILNQGEKDPSKYKYTPIVFNEAMQKVGPYTPGEEVEWPKQQGLMFDIQSLDKIAGRTSKVVSASRMPGQAPVYMHESEALGLVPGSVYEKELTEKGLNARAIARAGGGKDDWTKYQDKASKFFSTHKNIVTGKYYDMGSAWEAQKIAQENGIHLVFNKGVDPETGAEGVQLVDHHALDQSVEVAAPSSSGQQEGERQLNPSEVVDQPMTPGVYTDTDTGEDKYWDGKNFIRVRINGKWTPISKPASVTPAAVPTIKGDQGSRAGLMGARDAHAATTKEAVEAAPATTETQDSDGGDAIKKEARQTAGWIIEDPKKEKIQKARIRKQYDKETADQIIAMIDAMVKDYSSNSGLISKQGKETIRNGVNSLRTKASQAAGGINRAYQNSPRANQPF